MAQQSRGAPYPLGTDPNNTAADIQALALWANERPGITPATTTQRNAMTGIERWDGRIVLDTTLDRLFRWDAGTTTWIQIADSSEVAALLATSGTPAALAITASRGVATSAARADHVHPWPAYAAWTPTFQAEFGTLNTVTVVTARRIIVGPLTHFYVRFILTDIGTASGSIRITNMLTAASGVEAIMPGRDHSSGPMLQGLMANSTMNILKYDNLSTIAAGKNLSVNGTYELA